MSEFGKLFIIFGTVLIFVGLMMTFFGGIQLPRLPGDIYIKRDGFTLYFPIVSSIIISILLSIIINFFLRK